MYLHRARSFPEAPDVLMVPDELWEALSNKPELALKREADKASYIWDRLIGVFSDDILGDNLELTSSPTDAEKAVRIMAREDRFDRRILGEAFKDFLDES